MIVKKGSFKLSIPLCCIKPAIVSDNETAHKVYNWMRIACYQYSILNVLLSIIMFIVIFIPHNKDVDVSLSLHQVLISSLPITF